MELTLASYQLTLQYLQIFLVVLSHDPACISALVVDPIESAKIRVFFGRNFANPMSIGAVDIYGHPSITFACNQLKMRRRTSKDINSDTYWVSSPDGIAMLAVEQPIFEMSRRLWLSVAE